MGQPTSAEIGDSSVIHGPADVGSEMFGLEIYTYVEISAWEVYLIGTTPGVFQCVRRFLLWSLDFRDVLRRSHSRSVPVCLYLEMHSRGTTPGAFCVSGDFYSGVCISEMYFRGMSPGAFRVSGYFYSGVWISEMYFRGVTPGVFQCVCIWRCTLEELLQEHSVCLEIFTPESVFRRCTSEESLQECFSVYAIVFS
jgi:hypothetical protein